MPLQRTLAALTVALAGLLVSPPLAAAADPLDYVALGDSSAAGPLIPVQVDAPCLRSSGNWPHVAAAALGANLTDVTCSGATTGDLTGRQFGFVAPQFDALRPDTDVVTIAIGANDIDLAGAVISCSNPLPQPVGSSCRARYTAGGVDQLAARVTALAPKVAAVLDGIRARSPHARIFVATYATYWRPGGCWPVDPIWAADADYLQATWDRLHAMLGQQAASRGAGLIDLRTPSADHGTCASGADKWMEGLVPTSAAAPWHPNATGMRHSGATVAAAIGAVGAVGAVGATSTTATALPVAYSAVPAGLASLANPGGPPPGANDWSCRSTAHPNPVVLVHGTNVNMVLNWNTLSPLLKNNGYCVFALNYGGLKFDQIGGQGDIPTSAVELGEFVDRVLAATGASSVDFVGHSQGGMLPQYYVKFLGGASKTRTIVGLGADSHGSTAAGFAVLIDTIATAFPWTAALLDATAPAIRQQEVGSEFVTHLTSVPDTVPGVRYTMIASHRRMITGRWSLSEIN